MEPTTFAVLGTGDVGRRLADALVGKGHTVVMGSRTADNEAGSAWADAAGEGASVATFADASAACEIAILAVSGQHALAVVEAAKAGLAGKVLLDITNPLDFSQGFPPRLFVCNDDSLGEQVQRAAPEVRVVKTLNTLANALMVDAAALPEPTEVFVAGEDDAAKETAKAVLADFGYADPVDMGGIEASRGLEAWLLLWTRLYGTFGTAMFNLRLVREPG